MKIDRDFLRYVMGKKSMDDLCDFPHEVPVSEKALIAMAHAFDRLLETQGVGTMDEPLRNSYSRLYDFYGPEYIRRN
tara:strand:- start:5886 stop:6116 length:231 start_codon:yes stop_codon:yes gene_type:complete